jgi:hypothetical protein
VRRETGDQTDQESRSAGHRAATTVTVMDIIIHVMTRTPPRPAAAKPPAIAAPPAIAGFRFIFKPGNPAGSI